MNAAAHREYLKILTAEIAEGEDRLADLRRKGEEIWQQYAELQAELEESRRVIRSALPFFAPLTVFEGG
jgi:predicted  nucleic acid-binding Zn-ribbon protein